MTVEVIVDAPVHLVWSLWTTPEHITKWNRLSEDWVTPIAGLDLREGGRFFYQMESRAGTDSLNYEGTFTAVTAPEQLAYTLDDGRQIEMLFSKKSTQTHIHQTFDVLDESATSQEYQSWQAILLQFKQYAESQR